ncbi:hypothetical protein BD779DRAFT_1525954 [Infundibulicybe gibba]|nr:hypothetical protein BD779DRAFT_1525954 [Infundibulicybe gibba]
MEARRLSSRCDHSEGEWPWRSCKSVPDLDVKPKMECARSCDFLLSHTDVISQRERSRLAGYSPHPLPPPFSMANPCNDLQSPSSIYCAPSQNSLQTHTTPDAASMPPSPHTSETSLESQSRSTSPPLSLRVPTTRLRVGNRVPRPRNAFMIYRSEFWAGEKISRTIERDHRHISRIIGHCWNQMPEEEKDLWRAKAEVEKLEHEQKYPGYRFTPGLRAKKPIKRNVKRNGTEELLRCKQVAELILAGKKGNELETAVLNMEPLPVEACITQTPKKRSKKPRATAAAKPPPPTQGDAGEYTSSAHQSYRISHESLYSPFANNSLCTVDSVSSPHLLANASSKVDFRDPFAFAPDPLFPVVSVTTQKAPLDPLQWDTMRC